MNTFSITPTELQKSAVQYLPQLLKMPVIAAQETLRHMTPRPGTRGRVVLGELSGDIDLGPYDPSRVDKADLSVHGRTLETFLGSVIKEFDPNSVWASVYGSLTTQGDALKDVNAAREVLSFLAAMLGRNLNRSIWSAVRNPAGSKTSELFDGLDTITSTEIAAGKISEQKKNLFLFPDVIDRDNAVDLLKTFYWAASDELQGQPVKLYMPYNVMHAYEEAYQTSCGCMPYNNRYEKRVLEGSNGLCELVPLTSKAGSPYLTLSPQQNLVFGYGDGLADENISIEKYHAFYLQFVATMYFGVQFKSVSPEMLCIGKLNPGPDGPDGNDEGMQEEWVEGNNGN